MPLTRPEWRRGGAEVPPLYLDRQPYRGHRGGRTIRHHPKGAPMRIRHRLTRSFAVLLATAAALVGFTTPAHASDPKCNFIEGRRNVCLFIDQLPDGRWAVHVGIDINMTRRQAEAIVGTGNSPFTAEIRGDDGDESEDDYQFGLPLTRLVATDKGLTGEFDLQVDGSALDEDDGTDEIFARVHYALPNGTRIFTYDTPNFVGNF
jgi:hypothetical protein